jgi:hypothetical protein
MTRARENIDNALDIMTKHFDYATCIKEEDNLYHIRYGLVDCVEYEWTISRPDWFSARLMAEAMWEQVYEDFSRRSRIQEL